MTDNADIVRHELTFAPGKACIVCGKETFFGQSYEVKMRVHGDWKTIFHALYPLCPDHATFQPLRQGIAKRPLLALAAYTR